MILYYNCIKNQTNNIIMEFKISEKSKKNWEKPYERIGY